MSQQPLGLVLSFYIAIAMKDWQTIPASLNSRLGLYWVFTTNESDICFQFGEGLNSRLGLHWVFTCRPPLCGWALRCYVSTAAWACIEFLPIVWSGTTSTEMCQVSTAAWACIEFLPFRRNGKEYKTIFWSQQPLGLALSFYRIAVREHWEDEASSQQPLGLALSFYDREDPIDRMVWNYCLNSRLGLHWVFTWIFQAVKIF